MGNKTEIEIVKNQEDFSQSKGVGSLWSSANHIAIIVSDVGKDKN